MPRMLQTSIESAQLGINNPKAESGPVNEDDDNYPVQGSLDHHELPPVMDAERPPSCFWTWSHKKRFRRIMFAMILSMDLALSLKVEMTSSIALPGHQEHGGHL